MLKHYEAQLTFVVPTDLKTGRVIEHKTLTDKNFDSLVTRVDGYKAFQQIGQFECVNYFRVDQIMAPKIVSTPINTRGDIDMFNSRKARHVIKKDTPEIFYLDVDQG